MIMTPPPTSTERSSPLFDSPCRWSARSGPAGSGGEDCSVPVLDPFLHLPVFQHPHQFSFQQAALVLRDLAGFARRIVVDRGSMQPALVIGGPPNQRTIGVE